MMAVHQTPISIQDNDKVVWSQLGPLSKFDARDIIVRRLFDCVWSCISGVGVSIIFAILIFDITRFDELVDWLKVSACRSKRQEGVRGP
jgi:hypothetical protein